MIVFPLILGFMMACNSTIDCTEIADDFTSYRQAESLLRETTHSFEDENYPSSNWIKKLEYFSCDGQVGYLILSTKQGKSYLYQKVPISVWEEMERAESVGEFYHRQIKNSDIYIFSVE
jgi:hypothetical protein